MVRREIAPTSQALQVAFSRLFREPMLSESTSFGSRWGIYEMSSTQTSLSGAKELAPKESRELPPQLSMLYGSTRPHLLCVCPATCLRRSEAAANFGEFAYARL